jgi:hypothetical protein
MKSRDSLKKLYDVRSQKKLMSVSHTAVTALQCLTVPCCLASDMGKVRYLYGIRSFNQVLHTFL